MAKSHKPIPPIPSRSGPRKPRFRDLPTSEKIMTILRVLWRLFSRG